MMQAVLFDYDGTLMDTEGLILDSWVETFRHMDVPCPSEEELKGTFGEPLARTMARFFPEGPVEEPLQAYRAYNQAHFLETVQPYPHMIHTIRRLREEGIRTGIVTARLRQTTCLGLDKYDMRPLFDTIVAEDSCAESKPDPTPVRIALEEMGLGDLSEDARRHQVLFVGDTKHDYHCAKNAGVKIALVRWATTLAIGNTDLIALDRATGEKLHPDYILPEAPALLAIAGCSDR